MCDHALQLRHRAPDILAVARYDGFKKAKVILKLKVQHFPRPDPFGDGQVDAIRAYFSPGLKSLGQPWRAGDGQLATQSVIDCSGS